MSRLAGNGAVDRETLAKVSKMGRTSVIAVWKYAGHRIRRIKKIKPQSEVCAGGGETSMQVATRATPIRILWRQWDGCVCHVCGGGGQRRRGGSRLSFSASPDAAAYMGRRAGRLEPRYERKGADRCCYRKRSDFADQRLAIPPRYSKVVDRWEMPSSTSSPWQRQWTGICFRRQSHAIQRRGGDMAAVSLSRSDVDEVRWRTREHGNWERERVLWRVVISGCRGSYRMSLIVGDV